MLVQHICLAFILTTGLSNANLQTHKVDITKIEFLKAKNASLDRLMDDNIDLIKNLFKSYDPHKIPDLSHKAWPYFYFFVNGQIKSLSQIHRVDHNSLSYDNRTLTINMNYGWKDIEINYDAVFKTLLTLCNGHFIAHMTDLKLNVVIEVDFKNYDLKLKNLYFYNLGNISVKYESGFFCKIWTQILKAVTKLAKSTVLKTMQDTTITLIQNNIDVINKILRDKRGKTFSFINLLLDVDFL